MMSEAQLEQFFQTRVRAGLGGMPIKLIPVAKGTPDRLVLLPGGVLELVELKTETGRLSPAQQHWHAVALQLGVRVQVLHGEQGVRDWLQHHGNRLSNTLPKPRGRRRSVLGRAEQELAARTLYEALLPVDPNLQEPSWAALSSRRRMQWRDALRKALQSVEPTEGTP